MVSIRKVRKSGGFPLRRKGRRRKILNKESMGLIAAALCLGCFATFLYSAVFSESGENSEEKIQSLRKTKKHPVLMETTEDGDSQRGNDKNPVVKRTQRMKNEMNAVALDITENLDCEKLLKEAEDSSKLFSMGGEFSDGVDDFLENARRRLQQDDDDDAQEKWGDLLEKEQDKSFLDDFIDDDNMRGGGGFVDLSAKHLLCIAASENPPEVVTNKISCDGSKGKQKALLQLWSSARSQMSLDLVKKVLDLARESNQIIQGRSYNLWAPVGDVGLSYMVNTLNTNENVDRGGLNGLGGALGPGKTFVDVGSCLGLTCLVVNNKYPGTKIVSIEPASPNWLLQELNLRCNLPKKDLKNIRIILEGVGANDDEEDNMMSKIMWRPTTTTSARSWTPKEEYKDGDEELVVRLRNLKSILAEANVIPPAHIDVLNVDCQGCEYSMIPEMTDEEFEEIPTVTGQVHWGYIQSNKLPSSRRGSTTHQRLCGHENIARSTRECCAFPDTPVKSSTPGEVLEKNDDKEFLPRKITVSDVIAEKLCDNFEEWTTEHLLNDVNDDFNWFELSSQA